MKIAVFTDSFLPGNGGTEHAVLNICNSFKELGNEVILFAPDYHREQQFNDFTVYRLKSIKFNDNDMMAFVGCELKRITKIVKDFSPDIIYYCTALSLATCAVKVGKKLNVPVVATIHTKFKEAFYNTSKSRFFTNCLIKSLVSKLNKTDKVATVCYAMKKELYSYGYKGQVQVIKNGVPQSNVKKDFKSGEIGDCAHFIFCGRLEKFKNVQFTLKALGILKREKNLKDFKFTIVGFGNYEKALKKLTKKEGLDENVTFTGFVGDAEHLNGYYKEADLLLFPSVFDNDSLVILEAAYNGVPTLTLRDCGSSERITDGENGFVAEYDARKFAEKIYGILTDKELYSKVCENVHTVTANSWRQSAEEYIALFEDCIRDKKAPDN